MKESIVFIVNVNVFSVNENVLLSVNETTLLIECVFECAIRYDWGSVIEFNLESVI